MVPVLMHTPPTMSRRSTTAARLPSLAVGDRGLLSAGTGPEHQHVEVVHAASLPAIGVALKANR